MRGITVCSLSLLLSTGCADEGLISAEDEPVVLAELEGRISDGDRLPPLLDDVAIRPTVVWIGDREAGIAEGAVTAAAELPDRVRLHIHQRPPAHLHHDTAQGLGSWAVARLLLYADVSETEQWVPGVDPLVGSTGDVLLLHVQDEALPLVGGGYAAEGFSLVASSECDASAMLGLRAWEEDTLRFEVDPDTPFPVIDFALACP